MEIEVESIGRAQKEREFEKRQQHRQQNQASFIIMIIITTSLRRLTSPHLAGRSENTSLFYYYKFWYSVHYNRFAENSLFSFHCRRTRERWETKMRGKKILQKRSATLSRMFVRSKYMGTWPGWELCDHLLTAATLSFISFWVGPRLCREACWICI